MEKNGKVQVSCASHRYGDWAPGEEAEPGRVEAQSYGIC
jgi:hypothetical protein